jgi:hypothetical protein
MVRGASPPGENFHLFFVFIIVAVRGGLLGGVGEVWRVQILKFKPNQRAVGSLAVRPPPPPQLLVASCSTIARVDFKMLPSVVMLCSVQLVLLLGK